MGMAERQHPEDRDVDAIFESIIARFDEPGADEPPPVDPPRPRRQSTGDVQLPIRPVSRDPDTSDTRVPWRTDPTNSVADALLGSDTNPGIADDDEGFTPPPPAPLPPLSDRLFWGAIAGLVLGPLGLLWLVLTQSGGFWSMALVISLTVGGFACMVLRQPNERGYDPENGARV